MPIQTLGGAGCNPALRKTSDGGLTEYLCEDAEVEAYAERPSPAEIGGRRESGWGVAGATGLENRLRGEGGGQSCLIRRGSAEKDIDAIDGSMLGPMKTLPSEVTEV